MSSLQARSLLVVPVGGIEEVTAGADLAVLITRAAQLVDGDIVVVSSKIVSKALGLSLAATSRDDAVASATRRVVAARRTPHGLAQIVEAEAGPVMAAAGVDNSNVAPGTVLLLPADPDAEARDLLGRLRSVSGRRVGVIISDTAGRAWRDGQTDFALGAAGIMITDDLRGISDTHGQPMAVTVRAVADEIAAAADLVKGKLTKVPVAVVRGLSSWVTGDDGPGAKVLLRTASDDWFRLGHVEAVRSSLGLDPSDVAPPAVPASPVAERLARVLAVALAATIPGWPTPQDLTTDLLPDPLPASAAEAEHRAEADGEHRAEADEADGEPIPEAEGEPRQTARARARLTLPAEAPGPHDWLHLGALAQAVAAAAWSEDLHVTLTPAKGPPLTLDITAHPR